MSRERRPPGLGSFITNWRAYDAPLASKLRMALANNWTKLRRRRDCCGHPGQPGC